MTARAVGRLAPLLLLLLSCSDSENKTPADGGLPDKNMSGDLTADVGKPDSGPPPCGTAFGTLPSTATTITWDDGTGKTHARKQTWQVTVGRKKVALASLPLRESARFDLKHPAKILGFSVQWTNVPVGSSPTSELKAGLYPDFGHNGFDFWAKKALWEGTRCVRDHKPGSWLTYVLKTPVEIKQPGLVYVAHTTEKTTEPVWLFDGSSTSDGKCSKFTDCHSSLNAHKVLDYYHGLTVPIPYDFLVRLHVEYTKNLKDSEKIFQKVSGGPSGKHVSWGDYNNDGWDDALVAGKLYKNENGTLKDVTAAAKLNSLGFTPTGGVWGDYNNDGCLDLFAFVENPSRADALFKSNCDGTFTDVTQTAGFVDKQSYHLCQGESKNTTSPTAAAAWVDIDTDGYIDLYLTNFICWAKTSTDKEFFYIDTVFRNKGDGTFEELTSKKGFSSDKFASRTVAPADFDADGDVDIFVGNYRLHQNQFFVNQGSGTVLESAQTINAAGSPYIVGGRTYYGHTIGSAWGDLDNDGDLDLVVGNLAHPRFYNFSNKTQLLLNQGNGTFVDGAGAWKDSITSPSGLWYRETHSVPALADFNHDGDLDMVITSVYDGRPTDFYWGKGGAKYDLDIYTTGVTTENGWGLASSDVDNDGDPDLFATELFKNTLASSAKGSWLQVRVLGKKGGPNWASLGAVVKVTAGGKTWIRQVQGGTGKGGQDSMYLHFGLGKATSVSGIEVVFPGKTSVKYSGPFTTNQRIWVYRDGTSHNGWTPKK